MRYGSGIIASFSPAAEAMFGHKAEDVIGQPLALLMPEPYRTQHDGYMERYLQTGERRVIGIGREVRGLRANGEVFVAEIAVGELVSGGQPLFTGFIRDITDRVAAERKAIALQHSLDQVSRIQMLGELATALAHEINQPLTALSNFALAAKRKLSEAEAATASDRIGEARELLDLISQEGLRAGEILKRMRRLVDRGQVDAQPENINSIVVEAGHLGQARWAADHVHLFYDLADDLPPVLADRVQIQQVILNLLKNAVEAVVGAHAADIDVSTALEGGSVKVAANRHSTAEVVITVHDNGPGLNPEMIDRIFEPFTSEKENGLGVGLAICRSIIDAHGGRIWAENAPDGGASFHFTPPTADTA
ncbi:MAG: ATP-binding protein [Pseudomonadota bacterium]